MKFTINNLGPIKCATITLSRLNVIFGPNNTGKTYLTYAIWGFLNFLSTNKKYPLSEEMSKQLASTGSITIAPSMVDIDKIVTKATANYSKSGIVEIFNSGDQSFPNFKISLDSSPRYSISPSRGTNDFYFPGSDGTVRVTSRINKENEQAVDIISSISRDNQDSKSQGSGLPRIWINEFASSYIASSILLNGIARGFAITSERTGVALFYKNLDYNKSEAIDYIMKNKNINPFEVLSKITSKYAKPIQENIDLARDYPSATKKTSFIYKNPKQYNAVISSWENLLGGKFSERDDKIVFISSSTSSEIPMHLSSSALKSTFLIDVYIKHIIKSTDACFIDEPELNLSPANQVKMARFLIELSKVIPCVTITTHSDYIAREINIALGREIDPKHVGLYFLNEQSELTPIPTSNNGYNVEIFDSVLADQINRQ